MSQGHQTNLEMVSFHDNVELELLETEGASDVLSRLLLRSPHLVILVIDVRIGAFVWNLTAEGLFSCACD